MGTDCVELRKKKEKKKDKSAMCEGSLCNIVCESKKSGSGSAVVNVCLYTNNIVS